MTIPRTLFRPFRLCSGQASTGSGRRGWELGAKIEYAIALAQEGGWPVRISEDLRLHAPFVRLPGFDLNAKVTSRQSLFT